MTKHLIGRGKSGFTLMEIMVVIIVIAVLASVAGPMIGTITDQGRASATKAQMSNIKSGLVAFKSDTGHYPHNGSIESTAGAVNLADTSQMGTTDITNVLVNNLVANYGIAAATFAKRWKGPYMDSDPSDFMSDGWSSKINYRHDNKQIWLRSFGPDNGEDTGANCQNVSSDGYTGDDISLPIVKVKY